MFKRAFLTFILGAVLVNAPAAAVEDCGFEFLGMMAALHGVGKTPLTLASTMKDGRVEFSKNIASVEVLTPGRYKYTFKEEVVGNYGVQVCAATFEGMAPKVSEASPTGFIFEFDIHGRGKPIPTKHTLWVYPK